MAEQEDFFPKADLTESDIETLYPSTTDWLADHNRAQLLGEARLLSAEEKVQRFGGREQLRADFDRFKPGDRTQAIFLKACRDGEMHKLEIMRFSAMIGLRISNPDAYLIRAGINLLEEKGLIERVPDLAYLAKLTNGLTRVYSPVLGYRTTEEGLRAANFDFPLREVTSLGQFNPGWAKAKFEV